MFIVQLTSLTGRLLGLPGAFRRCTGVACEAYKTRVNRAWRLLVTFWTSPGRLGVPLDAFWTPPGRLLDHFWITWGRLGHHFSIWG